MPRLLSLHGVLEAEETLRGLVELRGRGKGFGHGTQSLLLLTDLDERPPPYKVRI